MMEENERTEETGKTDLSGDVSFLLRFSIVRGSFFFFSRKIPLKKKTLKPKEKKKATS